MLMKDVPVLEGNIFPKLIISFCSSHSSPGKKKRPRLTPVDVDFSLYHSAEVLVDSALSLKLTRALLGKPNAVDGLELVFEGQQ